MGVLLDTIEADWDERLQQRKTLSASTRPAHIHPVQPGSTGRACHKNQNKPVVYKLLDTRLDN
jgi:hypothetical protein